MKASTLEILNKAAKREERAKAPKVNVPVTVCKDYKPSERKSIRVKGRKVKRWEKRFDPTNY